jgi:WD40 repeat protein
MKNNFNGKEITLGCVSVYHGFIAIGSNSKSVYIWDYEYSKLLMEITLPLDEDPNIEPTSLSFINGYSILVIGTSDGTVYFLKLSKGEQGYQIQTIGIYKPIKI